MQAMTRRRSALLGVLVLGLGGVGMTGACAPNEPAPLDSCSTPAETPTETPTECATPMEDACMRYHIPLDGNPSTDVALRSKYIAAFGSACYLSVVNTFDCFYKTWQAACADAVKIAEVAGAAPFDKGYTCQPVVGTEDYTLQVGPDVANKITINYQAAPLESSFIDVDGTPTEINGPYRNLPQLTTIKPGADFDCKTGIVGERTAPLSPRGSGSSRSTARITVARFAPISRASRILARRAVQRFAPSRSSSKFRMIRIDMIHIAPR